MLPTQAKALLNAARAILGQVDNAVQVITAIPDGEPTFDEAKEALRATIAKIDETAENYETIYSLGVGDVKEAIKAISDREATEDDLNAVLDMLYRGRLNELFHECVEAVID